VDHRHPLARDMTASSEDHRTFDGVAIMFAPTPLPFTTSLRLGLFKTASMRVTRRRESTIHRARQKVEGFTVNRYIRVHEALDPYHKNSSTSKVLLKQMDPRVRPDR